MVYANRPAHNRLELSGQVFGRLTAVSICGSTSSGQKIWLCQCACGGEARTTATKLRSGHTLSCGCIQRERAASANTKHGLLTRSSKRDLIDSYGNMLDRCYNENSEHFHHYGGRGIHVCDRWRFGEGGKTGFQCFAEDVGERPNGLTLDRRDNDGPYEPSNVRWASRKEQARNRRSNLLIPLGAELVSVAEYAERTGIKYSTLINRIRRGWQPSQLTAPLKWGGGK